MSHPTNSTPSTPSAPSTKKCCSAPPAEAKGAGGGDPAHIGNFLEAIRGNGTLNSPIDEGQKSTMMCHLGNIAYRTNTVVRCDPKTGKLIDNPEGEKLWKRAAYREGWGI